MEVILKIAFILLASHVLLVFIYCIKSQLNKIKRAKCVFGLILITQLLTINAYSQQTFRRHFIIAHDISPPFIEAVRKSPSYKEALISLFSNEPVYRFHEAYQDNINIERRNGLPFFDQDRDEISFFHFNIAGSEFTELRKSALIQDEKGLVLDFNRYFIKDKNFCWTNYSIKGNSNPAGYLNKALSMKPNPLYFQSGVSMSNFVYPLVLNKIDTTKYAEEYILIILSDFLTGSMLGNTKDLDRVRDIYRVNYGIALRPNSPVSYVKKHIDALASQYYKIDFFQYSFISHNTNNPIGIISYKIKPKIGILTPEDVSLFVDSDLSLNQKGYLSKEFKTSKTKIKFTHNKKLVPFELRLIITSPFNRKDSIHFHDAIAARDEMGNWQSKYTDDRDLMKFDSLQLTYFLPSVTISLDSSINNRNFKNLKFQYEFKSKYIVGNTQPLNFIYRTEKELPIENIDYSTKATIIIMYYLLPILAVLLVLIFLAVYGKPIRLTFRIDGYLDSFEIIDYKTLGKLLTPYKAWNPEKQKVDHLLIQGKLGYKSPEFPLNWNSIVYLRLQDITVPDGFEMFLKHNTGDIKEFGFENPMSIKKGKGNKLSFVVAIRQNDITKQLVKPELVKFTIEAVVIDSIFLIKSELRETLEYKFHIGTDLGDVWVGFDPGTSGSCVAVGSATDNIILGEDRAKIEIIPSILVFEKAANYHPNGMEIPEKIYEYGTKAKTLYPTTSRYKGFQSIKKLLGFRDIKEVVFENNNILRLKGKDLASLLVKRLFKDISTHFNRPDSDDDYKCDGKFNPLRGVVAIPNNFTISKIQDMVDCIGKLNQFKEIRYVYEAEAVLFYYLSNFSQLIKGETLSNEETILVFDMGGATINATIVRTKKAYVNDRAKYNIDLLGKIGYGIGGDTIDYCLSKFILGFANEFPQLGNINIFDKKIQLADLAFQIKKEIIANYYTDKDYLITAYNLEAFINKSLSITINVNERTSGMYKYFIRESGTYKLFVHPLFNKTIYSNVVDAVKEVLQLSGITQIDKVIFSGRSTSFPMIKETVEKQLKSVGNKSTSIALSLEESKIAVAKGACWYGINRNSVRLNNLKTNAAFGFKKTLSADKTDVKFYELVEMGCPFDTHKDGIDSFEGSRNITDDFAFDGGKVSFYQIMGKDADNILSEGQKHKYSRIANINLDQVTSKVAMKVNENDDIDCAVKLQSNRIISERGVVSDQEIDEANEEHYTWIVK